MTETTEGGTTHGIAWHQNYDSQGNLHQVHPRTSQNDNGYDRTIITDPSFNPISIPLCFSGFYPRYRRHCYHRCRCCHFHQSFIVLQFGHSQLRLVFKNRRSWGSIHYLARTMARDESPGGCDECVYPHEDYDPKINRRTRSTRQILIQIKTKFENMAIDHIHKHKSQTTKW